MQRLEPNGEQNSEADKSVQCWESGVQQCPWVQPLSIQLTQVESSILPVVVLSKLLEDVQSIAACVVADVDLPVPCQAAWMIEHASLTALQKARVGYQLKLTDLVDPVHSGPLFELGTGIVDTHLATLLPDPNPEGRKWTYGHAIDMGAAILQSILAEPSQTGYRSWATKASFVWGDEMIQMFLFLLPTQSDIVGSLEAANLLEAA